MTIWSCPYCRNSQVLTDKNTSSTGGAFYLTNTALGPIAFRAHAVVCLNQDCLQPTVSAQLYSTVVSRGERVLSEPLQSWDLLPASLAKPQPDLIPAAIRADYYEACGVRTLSPKASATLARRCLQGMIRDFCGISKNRLIDEIRELRDQLDDNTAAKGVTYESVDAIDAVRSVGNISAHMEKEVDLIVEIDPGEAQMLIDLIEMLFEEWYIERDKRTRRLAEITALSAQKASELADLKLAKLGDQNNSSTPGETSSA